MRLLLLLAPMALLTACSAVPSETTCVEPVPYSAASQTQAAAEVAALPATAELRRMMDDYAAERAGLRANCRM